jgi:3-ketosteroid 9alpha-monooxygenase subunit B
VNAEVVEIRPETSSAATLALRLDAPSFDYRPGQWIRIDPHQFGELAAALRERTAKRGKPEGPGYFSISSDALRPGYLEITVKASDRPGGSPLPDFLVRGLRTGAKIAIDGPGGQYGYPDPMPAGVEGVIHVCAGSGAAPNRGLIRHALGKGWPLKHLLVVQDRSPEDMLFRGEWEALEAAEKSRFRRRTALSRTSGEYVSSALIAEAARGFLSPAACLALICGPNEPRGAGPGFTDLARAALAAVGVPADRVLGERA